MTLTAEAPVRWRRRKEARPQELLDAALEVFVEKGFADARLDDIAKRAGVSKGTIYLYFESKQDVFEAMVRRLAEARFEVASALIHAHQGSAQQLLTDLIRLAGQFVREPPYSHFPRLIIAESRRFPELAAFCLRELIHKGMTLFGLVIAKGQETGEFRALPSLHMVRLAMAPIVFMAIFRSAFEPHDDQPFDVDGHIATHLDIFIRGLRAEGGPA
ncbi:MAG TPA: TetR family transcriptional regulator [Alphaproteobacteria bacterium]|nr:TetR family transcriptional regulator [Alphaproteobacteria bacterium]HAJ44953.1 TetR family transcriptional regulator [Alphaproteobacteria bacterium]